MAPRISVIVRSVDQARTYLQGTLQRFRRDSTEPLIFGEHNRPEAVVIPYDAYLRLVRYDDAAEAAFAGMLQSRIADADAKPEGLSTLEDLEQTIDEPAGSILRKLRADGE